MRPISVIFLLAVVCACSGRSGVGGPLEGDWQLNRERTHYGVGVPPRSQERFSCASEEEQVRCKIIGEWEDGTRVNGSFEAWYGGKPGPVSGVPDVDAVSIRRLQPGSAEATFYFQGRPRFGYRTFKSSDGRSLIVVSIDPVTGRVLNSVVVYDSL
jgi:hypothetical protein